MTVKFTSKQIKDLEKLIKLSEEAGEIVQIISKYIIHGPANYHPDDPKTTNKTLLSREIGDLLALVETSGDLIDMEEVLEQKNKKLLKWK